MRRFRDERGEVIRIAESSFNEWSHLGRAAQDRLAIIPTMPTCRAYY